MIIGGFLKKDTKLMTAVFISLTVSCLSFMMIPLTDFSGRGFVLFVSYFLSFLFWAGIICVFVFLGMISADRKKYEKSMIRDKDFRRKKKQTKSRPGITVFFSNKYAVAADVLLAAVLIINIVMFIAPEKTLSRTVIFLSLLIFTGFLHSILNGVNFKYILLLKENGGRIK